MVNKWTEEEVDILKRWYGKIPIDEIIDQYLHNKTRRQILYKVQYLGIQTIRHYLPAMIDAMSAKCTRCACIKLIEDFHRHRNGQMKSFCKSCENTARRTKYIKNSHKYRLKDKSRYVRVRKEWLEFFIAYYGPNPYCSICSKQLKWRSSTKYNVDVVNWDHCSKKSDNLRCLPSGWLARNRCSEANIEKWLAYGLGILCVTCNKALPTKNRTEWLEKALEYTRLSNGIRL